MQLDRATGEYAFKLPLGNNSEPPLGVTLALHLGRVDVLDADTLAVEGEGVAVGDMQRGGEGWVARQR